MDRTIGKGTFRDAFKNQVVALSALPSGTGRQLAGRANAAAGELSRGSQFTYGIFHYTRMRYDNARQQLAELRKTYPNGASGAAFPGAMEVLPS
ncbi:hypothetical protein ACGFSB_06960 [Streptomyces sp. NPDC048441]|uniref:hypothetical protein n=1 Tax=Streptomyces sp. NPDC048441 TaxID=3365552 RepID=UPI00371DF10C